MPQTQPSPSRSLQRPAGTSAPRPPRCGRPGQAAPLPGPPRRGPQQGVPAASHRRRRGSGVPGGVDLGPFVALSGFRSCSPITLHPLAPWASLTGPDRNPTASPSWNRSSSAIPRRRHPGSPACPPARLAHTRRGRGAGLLPVPDPLATRKLLLEFRSRQRLPERRYLLSPARARALSRLPSRIRSLPLRTKVHTRQTVMK